MTASPTCKPSYAVTDGGHRAGAFDAHPHRPIVLTWVHAEGPHRVDEVQTGGVNTDLDLLRPRRPSGGCPGTNIVEPARLRILHSEWHVPGGRGQLSRCGRGYGLPYICVVVAGQSRYVAPVATKRHIGLGGIGAQLLDHCVKLFRTSLRRQVDPRTAQLRILVVDAAAHPPEGCLSDGHGLDVATDRLGSPRNQPEARCVRRAGYCQRLHEMQHACCAEVPRRLQRIGRRLRRRCGHQAPQVHHATTGWPL